jgi:hypothetical protein
MSRAQSKPLAAPKPQPPAPETLREEVVRLLLHNYDQARQGRVPTREDVEDSIGALLDLTVAHLDTVASERAAALKTEKRPPVTPA